MRFWRPDYIDREIPLAREDRRAIHHDAWKLWMKDWRNVSLYLGVALVFTAGGGLVGWYAPDVYWQMLLLGATYGGLAAFVFSRLHRFRFAPLVRRLVGQQGYEVCLQCGYWLRGLGHGTECCPECGATRVGVDGG